MKTRQVIEGETKLVIPIADLPEHAPVFYKPQQALARDISILIYSAYGGTVLDSMAGLGARAIRLAHYGLDVTANDLKSESVKMIEQNAALNKVELEILHGRAETVFHTRKFDIVDLDPFGSPAPFVHCALGSAKQLLGLAATDTSALSGTYPRVTRRRYGAMVKKAPNHPEIGVRLLAGFVIREAAKLERAARPVFAHIFQHYYRLYFELKKGAGRADRMLEQLGHQQGSGPLYLGRLWDAELLKQMDKKIEFGSSKTEKQLELIRQEAGAPAFYYEFHELCKQARVSPPNFAAFLDKVDGTKTHFSLLGFRSELPEQELVQILKK
ncbi:MAG: hypothetical protein GOU99_01985 [Candidatus Altiarchaeota archaeon]|nr:hypothetical protein [Candidatus Altiarchaeota archaeon]